MPPTTRDLDTAEYLSLVDAEAVQSLSGGVQIDVGARSDRGKVRPNNEDHFLAVRFGRSLETLKTNLDPGQVPARFDELGYGLVVADGVGGSAAGEVASGLAITAGVNLALNSPKWTLKPTPDEIAENMRTWRHRFRQIDHILARRAAGNPALSGMGTTLTIACSIAAELVLYHVGDSRCYLLRKGRLTRLTHDHTLAQHMADAGLLAPEEVARHRLRHALTNVVGRSGAAMEVEIQHLHLADGDRVLLCTDGLTEMVSDADIAAVLARAPNAQEACDALVAAALDGGGRDNVTVVLARYTIPATPPAPPAPRGP